MHLGNGLIDSILVLLSLESVVLNIVDQFQEEDAHHGVVELVLERLPAQQEEYREAYGSVDYEVHDHLIVEEHYGEWNIVA